MEIGSNGLDNLKSVTNRAIADGYVSRIEAMEIEKYALKDDNTVTPWEKDILQSAYNTGAYFEPRAKITVEKLATYGDISVSGQMNDLRYLKKKEHWFNDEYIDKARPVLVDSTDRLANRMGELWDLKSETNMFTSDYADLGKQIILNSNDSIAERMSALRNLKRSTNMFTSEFAEIGKQVLLNSYDNKSARLMALDQFKSEAGLWSSDYNDIRDAIMHDS